MKKALQISIAQTLFTIEEDAFAVLDSYLAKVKAHFASTAECDEIVADIESRIAEQLLESKHKVITLPTVETVLKAMGGVEEFGDEPASAHSAPPESAKKRLYRSSDDVLIAGVASGIATYIGIDPLWTRIAFFVLALFNGLGVLLYLILWFVMPEAKTASQKLEMTGSPVNLATLSETVKERVSEISEDKHGVLRRIISAPFKLMRAIFSFLYRVLVPLLRVGFGLVLVLGAMAALVGIMVASGFLLSGNALIADDIPVEALAPGVFFFVGTLGAILAALIPAVYVLIAGIALVFKKSYLTAPVGFGMLGVWLVSLVVVAFSGARIADNYQTFVRNSPAYEVSTTPIPIDNNFSKLAIEDGVDVVLRESNSVALTAEGRAKDIDRIRTRVENGTLIIERAPRVREQACIFCFDNGDAVTLTLDAHAGIDGISIKHGSSLAAEKLTTDALDVSIENGSRAEIHVDADSFTGTVLHGSSLELTGDALALAISVENGSRFDGSDFTAGKSTLKAAHGSRIDLQATGSLEIDLENSSSAYAQILGGALDARLLHGSELEARGGSAATTLSLENGSNFEGSMFAAEIATINAMHGSRADMEVTDTLTATASNGSSIIYRGNPEVTRHEQSGSIIRSDTENEAVY